MESNHVMWIRQNSVPWGSLAWSLWHLDVLQDVNHVGIMDLEAEVLFHVVVFQYYFLGLGKLNGLEEIWEVLVNFDFLGL
tara:strand:+ start:564 stop:803 length:240 start_codon:yes stop_codon:yes gene_type:complete